MPSWWWFPALSPLCWWGGRRWCFFPLRSSLIILTEAVPLQWHFRAMHQSKELEEANWGRRRAKGSYWPLLVCSLAVIVPDTWVTQGLYPLSLGLKHSPSMWKNTSKSVLASPFSSLGPQVKVLTRAAGAKISPLCLQHAILYSAVVAQPWTICVISVLRCSWLSALFRNGFVCFTAV